MYKAEQIKLGAQFITTIQQIEWVCNVCGAENTSNQDIGYKDSLIDPLVFDCNVCGCQHEVPKSILE